MKRNSILVLLLGFFGQALSVPLIQVADFDFGKLDESYQSIMNDLENIKKNTEFTQSFIADGGIDLLDPEVVYDYALLKCCIQNYSYLQILYYKFKSAISLIPKTNQGFTDEGAFVRFLTFMANNKSLAILSGPMFDRGVAYALQMPPTLYEKMKMVAMSALKGAALGQITLPVERYVEAIYREPNEAAFTARFAGNNILQRVQRGALVGGLYGGYRALKSNPSDTTNPLRKKKTWREFFGLD